MHFFFLRKLLKHIKFSPLLTPFFFFFSVFFRQKIKPTNIHKITQTFQNFISRTHNNIFFLFYYLYFLAVLSDNEYCKFSLPQKNSRIRETLNLLTNADSSTDTITDRNIQKTQKVSGVRCQVSGITCHQSTVTCHLSHVTNANSHIHGLSPSSDHV